MFANIDIILGIHAVKRGVFIIRSDHVALDQKPTIQDSKDIIFDHPQSWPPNSLTVLLDSLRFSYLH